MGQIAIIGAGAIGSSLGGLLRRANHDVLLIGRSQHVKAIQNSGLLVDGVLGRFTTTVQAAEVLQSRPSVAFLTMKTQDVSTTVLANLALLQGIPIVTFQNGVRSDEIVASLLTKERVVSVVINFHATFLAPGKVTILYAGELVIGRPFGPNDAEVNLLATVLRDAFPVQISENIGGAHWLKLIVNLNNALPALTDLDFHAVFRVSFLRNLAVRVMREALQVVDRAGIRLESLPGIPLILAQVLRLLPLPLASRVVASKIGQTESQWPLLGSTLQSLRQQQPTEIDYLNGEVVRLGQEIGVPTPLNATIVKMVHQVERTGRFFSVEAIRNAIGLADLAGQ
jgi:2-dehydropantoate 2-reductase